VLGPEVVKGLRFVCSDMWKPYLGVFAERASQALHVLDRFHITMHVNQAVDQVRRGESTRLRAAGKRERLKHMRWTLFAPWQPSTRSSPTDAAGVVIQQAGHRPGLGAEGSLAKARSPVVQWKA
jgi:transposase